MLKGTDGPKCMPSGLGACGPLPWRRGSEVFILGSCDRKRTLAWIIPVPSLQFPSLTSRGSLRKNCGPLKNHSTICIVCISLNFLPYSL